VQRYCFTPYSINNKLESYTKINDAQSKSCFIRFKNNDVITFHLMGVVRARKIADILTEWILTSDFLGILQFTLTR